MTAKLSVIATPIGNMEDITLRALRVLHECDVVLCEDTRITGKLLRHYEIDKPLLSYHSYSGIAKYDKIYSLLKNDKKLALVSDAGTPTISDPGAYLISKIRERFGDEVKIEAIPGPNALVSALSISGVHADSFIFLGFPPHKKGRKTFFDKFTKYTGTIVFYESKHRILRALESLKEVLSLNERVTVVREITKIHEEVIYGNIDEVLNYFNKHKNKVMGEFVVIVEKKK